MLNELKDLKNVDGTAIYDVLKLKTIIKKIIAEIDSTPLTTKELNVILNFIVQYYNSKTAANKTTELEAELI